MDIQADYQEALDYLYSFVDFSLNRSVRYSPELFNLQRMMTFMDALGNQERDYPVIHIAGSKGKGSVASLCASALMAAGYRTGLYTSPHLIDFTERIKIDGKNIPYPDLVGQVEKIKPVVATIPDLTTFEITTALAFLYFSDQKVDAAVIEVGLGGRLDATNVCHPLVTVITSLSYDHTSLLGETLTEISTEKAGIIKSGVPCVLAPQKDEARLVIERICEERGAPLIKVGKDIFFAPLSRSLENQTLLVWSPSEQVDVTAFIESGGLDEWEPTRLTIPLLGFHQVENAATAYTALLVANERGLLVNDTNIRDGFRLVVWPGRFEILQRYPPVIVDSAHNRDSALKLRLAIDDYFPGHPVILVFGVSEDKDIHGMFSELLPRVRQVIITQSYHPRAMQPDNLVEIVHQFGKPAKAIPDFQEAMITAEKMAAGECVVLITGSVFIAACGRQAWFERINSREREVL
jgi:dihydrofolate synthase / folylpolyglutamate synthase